VSAGKAKKRSGGRRRNYGPRPDQIGFRRFMPNYWANWLGSALFGLVGIAFVGWGVFYVFDQQVANGLVALALAVALGYMVYLFGSTRLRD
jgi:hypothetical protein